MNIRGEDPCENYADLDRRWTVYPGSAFTRCIHPHWGSCGIDMGMGSRQGASLLHCAACGFSMCHTNLFRIGKATTTICRRGCGVVESIDHVLLQCPCYSTPCERMVFRCASLGLAFSVDMMLCHPGVHRLTECIFTALCD